jgi:hypothetical protein
MMKAMELKYTGKNPNLLLKDPDYAKYGPLASMETLQNLHGQLLTDHTWPATASQLPSSPGGNATGDADLESRTGAKHGGGARPVPAHIKCHCCGGNHYKNDCPCDTCKAKRVQLGGRGGTGRGRCGGRSDRGSQGGRGCGSRPQMSWRFVKPADKTKPFNSADCKQWWWWCDLCNKGDGRRLLQVP